MSIRRCDGCEISWPAIDWVDKIPKGNGTYRTEKYTFEQCPQCLNATRYMMSGRAIDKALARSLVAHARFERFYQVWDSARKQKGDPSPEALGRLEAKQIYDLELALKDA